MKDGGHVETLNAGESGIVIINQTPFYAESGGQIGDRGAQMAQRHARSTSIDTQKTLGD